MFRSPFEYFSDAVLRAPTLGCMLMCLAAALIGVIIFLRKQSLLGESLSHAAYPGVILGILCAGALEVNEGSEALLSFFILIGAFTSGVFGLWLIRWMTEKMKVRTDSALCFVLSAFFGVGITLASHIQFIHASLYRKGLAYLYGQAATMTDIHVWIYASLAFLMIAMIFLFFKELQVILFDYSYAKSLGIKTRLVDMMFFFLTVLAIVIGIRSVGVVLMSAMLIAPPTAARQLTHKLSAMFFWAGIFGILSGYFGNYISVEGTVYLARLYPGARLALPTGPLIVLVASAVCLACLLAAPKRGVVQRMFRIGRFRHQCLQENILKTLWRLGPDAWILLENLRSHQGMAMWHLKWILSKHIRNGWVEKEQGNFYRLTNEGKMKAGNIVRLHRLWEVYLADYLGVGGERVHRSAEEMEHILTPELERELTALLKDPKKDPHQQPIPPLT